MKKVKNPLNLYLKKLNKTLSQIRKIIVDDEEVTDDKKNSK